MIDSFTHVLASPPPVSVEQWACFIKLWTASGPSCQQWIYWWRGARCCRRRWWCCQGEQVRSSCTPIHAAPLPAGHVHRITGVNIVDNRYKLTPEANAEYMREQVAKQQAGAGPEVNAVPGDSHPCHAWLVATCCSHKTTHVFAAAYRCPCQSSRPHGRNQPA